MMDCGVAVFFRQFDSADGCRAKSDGYFPKSDRSF
jgi:hypothetical protein